MKTLIKVSIAAVMITAGTALKGQDYPNEYLGLPGDNLNLYAVMNTFQDSRNLRVFERSINDPDNRINNLDLNGDNLVDYIMVSDNVDGNVHYIVLRVAINRKERQDVAVFTIQRVNNGEVYVQLTGDEALYGRNYIIEPAGQLLLADWPLVRNIYRSDYVVWQSDWYWGYYPDYWTPWRPSYWHYYYGYHYNYQNYWYTCYNRSYAHHDPYWRDHYYTGYRVWSPVVTVNIHSGHYKTTYSHPEQRRDGEEVYKRSNPDQGRRATYSNNTISRSGAGSREGSTVTAGRRTGTTGTAATTREQRSATTSSNEVRTIGSSERVQRPVQQATREERTVQPAVRQERPVQSQAREQRPATTSSNEIRTIGSSERVQRPVQQAVREERPVQSSTREERPVQSQAREQRPASTSSNEVRTIGSSERVQRPVQQAAREERPVQPAVREQRQVQQTSPSSAQRSNESERQIKSNNGSERAAAGNNNAEKDRKTESAGTTRRK